MDSSLHIRSNSNRPLRSGAAPSHEPSGASAPPSDPFASLEQEATQTYQVSTELLELARENAAAGGATKAYEVPAELMEMARQSKLARAAAKRAKATASERGAPAATNPKDLPQSGPRVSFTELNDDDREWVEAALFASAPEAHAESAAPEHPAAGGRPTSEPERSGTVAMDSHPELAGGRAPEAADAPSARVPTSSIVPKAKRSSRRWVGAACVIAVSIAAAVSAWRMRGSEGDMSGGWWSELRSLVASAAPAASAAPDVQ